MDFKVIFAEYPDVVTETYANSTDSDRILGHDGTKDFIRNNPDMAIPYLITIILGTFFGTAGNILIICSVLINKHLRLVGNVFIVNLAFADLCVTAFVDPFSIIGIIYGSVWFADKPLLCEAVASICLTSCFCSLLSIGAVAFNRYIHICKNHLYNKIFTLRNSLLMCLVLWIVCALCEMPNFIGWGDHVYDKKTMSCVWDRTADLSYTLFFSIGGVALPVLIISFSYLKIFLYVRASKRKVAGATETIPDTKKVITLEPPEQSTYISSTTDTAEGSSTKKNAIVSSRKRIANRRESVKLARTLFTIFVVFAVCWSPYAFIVALDYRDSYPQALHIFSILFAHTNSSLNCILYALSNRHFRESYLYLLGIAYCLRKFNKRIGQRKLVQEMTSHSTDSNSLKVPSTKSSTLKEK